MFVYTHKTMYVCVYIYICVFNQKENMSLNAFLAELPCFAMPNASGNSTWQFRYDK